jgi:hypothetical protein
MILLRNLFQGQTHDHDMKDEDSSAEYDDKGRKTITMTVATGRRKGVQGVGRSVSGSSQHTR